MLADFINISVISLRGDFHIHSKYSYDSVMEPRTILKRCKKLGFDVISITDHNSLKGSISAKKYEKEFNINVIVGEEIKTDVGDIIGLNLNEEILSTNIYDVLEDLREQGGIAVLPHPYREHKNIENIAKKVDLIEIFNSRSTIEENKKSLDLSLKLNIPPITGSDAHCYSEIGNSMTIFDDLYSNDKIFKVEYSKKRHHLWSHIVKDVKLYKYYKIPFHIMKSII